MLYQIVSSGFFFVPPFFVIETTRFSLLAPFLRGQMVWQLDIPPLDSCRTERGLAATVMTCYDNLGGDIQAIRLL